jgi:hypothetical protein
MWLYASGADSPSGNISDTDTPNIVLYDYHKSRAGHIPTVSLWKRRKAVAKRIGHSIISKKTLPHRNRKSQRPQCIRVM